VFRCGPEERALTALSGVAASAKLAVPGSLVEILASSSSKKCGLNARGDALRLAKDLGLHVNGVVELDDVADERGFGVKVKPLSRARHAFDSRHVDRAVQNSLQSLCRSVLHVDLGGFDAPLLFISPQLTIVRRQKSQGTFGCRTGRPLRSLYERDNKRFFVVLRWPAFSADGDARSQQVQLDYAITDAYASLLVHERLQSKTIIERPVPSSVGRAVDWVGH
jgi:hypothetical protein